MDTFAFGTLLWELLARQVPYDGVDPADIRAAVEREEKLKMPNGINNKLAQIINDCR